MSVKAEMQQIAEQEGFLTIDEWLVATYSKYKSTKKMEKIYGFAYKTFCNYLNRLGVKLRRGGARPHQLISIDREKLTKLYYQGASISGIAREFGIDRRTVYNRLYKWGLKKRKQEDER